MSGRARTFAAYAALFAAVFGLSYWWPAATNLAFTGASAAIIATLVIGVLWIAAVISRDRIREALHDGRPTFLFRSRQSPPWQRTRNLSSIGTRRDRADFRTLMDRLAVIPSTDDDPSDYLAPTTYRDRVTGQYWRENRYEVGFNQWSELQPITNPPDGNHTLNDDNP